MCAMYKNVIVGMNIYNKTFCWKENGIALVRIEQIMLTKRNERHRSKKMDNERRRSKKMELLNLALGANYESL